MLTTSRSGGLIKLWALFVEVRVKGSATSVMLPPGDFELANAGWMMNDSVGARSPSH
ncbi:MAG TPA: hypothetical protein V6C98_01790 [Thermosynechococcaceae cyanobacterium]